MIYMENGWIRTGMKYHLSSPRLVEGKVASSCLKRSMASWGVRSGG